MVTDSILEAVERMIDGCRTPEQKGAMEALGEMLRAFDEDKWYEMPDKDKQKWIGTYLAEMDKGFNAFRNNLSYEFAAAEMTIGGMLQELDKLNIDEVKILNTNEKEITDTPIWSGSMSNLKRSAIWTNEMFIQSVSIHDDWALMKFDLYQEREMNMNKSVSLNDRIKAAAGKTGAGSGGERKVERPVR